MTFLPVSYVEYLSQELRYDLKEWERVYTESEIEVDVFFVNKKISDAHVLKHDVMELRDSKLPSKDDIAGDANDPLLHWNVVSTIKLQCSRIVVDLIDETSQTNEWIDHWTKQ